MTKEGWNNKHHRQNLVLGPWSFRTSESPLNTSAPKPWLGIALLAAALLLWAGLFAAGAYINLGADRPTHDIRKPLIILGCMAAFLTFWGVALWLRARRHRRP